jgi:hypothetical protein
LPYISDLETLDIDTYQGPVLANKRMLINQLTLFLEKSRGVWGGTQPPTDDDDNPIENLEELKVRQYEGYDDTTLLQTGKVDMDLIGEWNNNGRVFIRQIDPLPITVLAIVPTGYLPVERD